MNVVKFYQLFLFVRLKKNSNVVNMLYRRSEEFYNLSVILIVLDKTLKRDILAGSSADLIVLKRVDSNLIGDTWFVTSL